MLWGVGESSKAAAVAIAAADLDTHMEGPPTEGPLLVSQLDRLVDGVQRYLIVEKTVAIGFPPRMIWGFFTDFPTNGTVVSLQINLKTAITGVEGAVKVGLGSSVPDEFGKTLDLGKNRKIDTAMIGAPVGFILPSMLGLCAVNTNGVLTGRIGGSDERIQVRMTYLTLNSMPDAP